MKQHFLILPLLLCSGAMMAQSTYVDNRNSELLRHHGVLPYANRTEIVLPATVNGLMPMRVDMHIHTYYSDGDVSPQYRVREAWADGLDAIAITDHIEYRPHDGQMAKYLKTENKGVDFNYPGVLAKGEGDYYGLIVVPGTEITRNPREVGHFNAIFTTDNNMIPDDDPMQAIRNAKKQGAIVVNNHPGWERTSNAPTEIEKQAWAEGLIDGIEIMNSQEFYPNIIDTALDKNFFMFSATDLHSTTSDDYGKGGNKRNFTIVFVDDFSADGLRRGLEKRLTIGHQYGTLGGEEQLLKDFFLASVSVKKAGNHFVLTNNTSLEYSIRVRNDNITVLRPFSSINIWPDDKGVCKVTVENMWCGEGKHPVVELTAK